MDRMGRTDQLVRYSDGRYLTFDPAEVAGCSAALYATDTRQSAQLHSLRAGRLSSPTPPHYARACVLRWDGWAVRSSQTSTYCACAGGRGVEADLRHVSVSERPTTDIRETCTYRPYSLHFSTDLEPAPWLSLGSRRGSFPSYPPAMELVFVLAAPGRHQARSLVAADSCDWLK